MKVTAAYKLLTITVPAVVLAVVALAACTEAWVRFRWDPRKGSPGFYESDPVRGERLGPNYTGWFAGVPVHVNALGLRDPREYDLRKGPTTFRILVLGDSVTFGHGSVFEHTYPFLTEQLLRKWRPDVDWQVWNAAVPGYNTSQELAQLLELGPRFQPDVVVIGFFENDVIDNHPVVNAGRARVLASAVGSSVRRHLYSLELYKRVYLGIAWRLSSSESFHQRLEHMGTEEALIANTRSVANAAEQQITPFETVPDDPAGAVRCPQGQTPNPELVPALQREPGWPDFLDAVKALQALHQSKAYRIVFFLNFIPPTCPDRDVFYDGGSAALNRLFVKVFSAGAPTVSAYDAFLHVRPSQMPLAAGHSIGNSNLVKAQTLFAFLRDSVLPSVLPARLTGFPSAPES